MKSTFTTLLLYVICYLPASGQYKTIFPSKVSAMKINEAPFRFNGAVISSDAATSSTSRGSGFHAWHKNTFFSAAHVVFTIDDNGEGRWLPPPVWYPRIHVPSIQNIKGTPSRGYVRWASYAEFASNDFTPSGFAKDVIVGYALKPIAKGSPASINLNGMKDLMSGKKYTITGYPAMNPYLDKPSDDDVINSSESFHIFRTKPFSSPFRKYADRAITTTLITTGPGNSGGPVWTINAKGNWTASGVLTGGLPSETIVYGFTPDMNSLLRSVKPIVSSPQATSMNVGGVENTSHFFPYTKKHTIPDGVHKWTNFRASVNTFPLGKTINTLRLSLDIKTPHRGDLYVMLTSPQGVNTIIHNEQGADTKNLVIKDLNLSETFKDTPPNGTWTLRVQDRLKGDICVLRSFRLEIGTDLY